MPVSTERGLLDQEEDKAPKKKKTLSLMGRIREGFRFGGDSSKKLKKEGSKKRQESEPEPCEFVSSDEEGNLDSKAPLSKKVLSSIGRGDSLPKSSISRSINNPNSKNKLERL